MNAARQLLFSAVLVPPYPEAYFAYSVRERECIICIPARIFCHFTLHQT